MIRLPGGVGVRLNPWVQATLDYASCAFLRQRPSAPDPARWAADALP